MPNNHGDFPEPLIRRYIKLLKDRISAIPKELYDILELKRSESISDFIHHLYTHQTFIPYDNGEDNAAIDLFELIKEKNVIIVGGAGCGKTMTSKYIVYELCNNILGSADSNPVAHKSQKIPIYVELGKISKHILKLENNNEKLGLKNLLVYLLNEEFPDNPDNEKLQKSLREYVSTGSVFMIFDGLDELTKTSQKKTQDLISELSRPYPSRFIVTTRKSAFFEFSGFSSLQIESFTYDQIDDYLIKWYKTDICKQIGSPNERKLYAWDLYNKLKDNELLGLARTPLILTQIVVLHKKVEDKLELNNISLMKEISRLLLFKWKSENNQSFGNFQKLRDKNKISDEEILSILGSVAFQFLGGKTDINRSDIIARITKHIEGIKDIEIENLKVPDIILDFLLNCDGLLNEMNESEEGDIFMSRKIQEFLAAYYMVRPAFPEEGYTEKLHTLLENHFKLWCGVAGFVFEILQDNAAVIFIDFLVRYIAHNKSNSNKHEIKIFCGMIVKNLEKRIHDSSKEYDFSSFSEFTIRVLTLCMKNIINDSCVTWENAIKAGDVLGFLGDERSNSDYILSNEYWLEKKNVLFKMESSNEMHSVDIPRFYISKYMVTNQQFNEFVENIDCERDGVRVPEDWNREEPYIYKKNYPVTGIHWEDALKFAGWIKKKIKASDQAFLEGKFIVRLPTETEWEQAAIEFENRKEFLEELKSIRESRDRNGMQILWDNRIWPIGLACVHGDDAKIYDLLNNVWEWTISPYEPDERHSTDQNPPKAIRGGYSAPGNPECLRTYRSQCHMYRPVYKIDNIGFRLVIEERKLKN